MEREARALLMFGAVPRVECIGCGGLYRDFDRHSCEYVSAAVAALARAYSAGREAAREEATTPEAVERAAWACLQALHANVPEADRPMSWSDMDSKQEARIRVAASAALRAALTASEGKGET